MPYKWTGTPFICICGYAGVIDFSKLKNGDNTKKKQHNNRVM